MSFTLLIINNFPDEKSAVPSFLFFVGFSSAAFSQAAGKGSAEKSGSSKVKPHAQTRHFDRAPKDPKMKHNGTSYKRKQSNSSKVDGDGFSNSTGGKKKRWWRRK